MGVITGIDAVGTSSWLVVEDVFMARITHGVVPGQTDITIRNSRFQSLTGNAIWFLGTEIQILGNLIRFGTGNAILAEGNVDRCIIADNLIESNAVTGGADGGIQFTSGLSTSLFITNNHLYCPTPSGTDSPNTPAINLTSQMNDVVVSENHIEGAWDGGIYMTSSSSSASRIEGNTILGGDGDGIKVAGTAHRINGNYINGCDFHGIEVTALVDSMIHDNLIYEIGQATTATYDGIFVDINCDRNSIQGNLIRSASVSPVHRYGINISAASDDDNWVGWNDLLNAGPTADFNDAGTNTRTPDLASLTDIVITGPADNEVLAYDSSSGDWINQTAAEAALATSSHVHAADDLTDVDTTTTTPVAGDLLQFDGANWVPITTLPNGEIYFSTPAATTIATAGTFVKAAGTTTLLSGSSDFTMPSNNRLTYGGTVTKKFRVTVALSMTLGAANEVLALRLAKNGTTIAATEIDRKTGASGDIGAAALTHLVELATNDYVEIWITNKSTTASPTIDLGNMVIAGLI